MSSNPPIVCITSQGKVTVKSLQMAVGYSETVCIVRLKAYSNGEITEDQLYQKKQGYAGKSLLDCLPAPVLLVPYGWLDAKLSIA